MSSWNFTLMAVVALGVTGFFWLVKNNKFSAVRLAIGFFLLLSLAFSIGALAYYFGYKEPTDVNYTTIEGKLKEYKDGVDRYEYPFFDVYLADRKPRFRIDRNPYEYFKKADFIKDLHAGVPLSIKVETNDLEHPVTPRNDPQETVWVAALNSQGKDYLSPNWRAQFVEKNKAACLPLGIFFGLCSCYWIYLCFCSDEKISQMLSQYKSKMGK